MMPNLTRLNLGTLLFALLPLAGCERGLGGGAYTESDVTLIVSNSASEGAAVDASASDASNTVAGFGTVKGRIVVDGQTATLAELLAKGAQTKDPICSVNAIPDESLIVSADGSLANAFIYLKKAPKGVEIPPVPSQSVLLDQKGCVFTPHALVVQKGQTLRFMNSDPVGHNVHTNALQNSSINQNVDNTGLDKIYDQAESLPIQTVCDIHAWMVSYHLVVDHPWAAVTGPDGSFEIARVPAGKMEFIVWHEKVGYVERSLKVDVVPDQTVEVPVKVPAAKLAGK